MENDQWLLNAGPSTHGWHKLSLAMRCPRLYAWNKQHPKDEFREPLAKGSLVHQGLAHFYQRMKCAHLGEDPDVYYTPTESIRVLAEQEAIRTGHPEWVNWIEFAQQAVEQYQMYWGEEEFRVVSVEHELWANVRDDKHDAVYPHTQRADLITEDKEGNIMIWDHKTTARMTSSTTANYSISGQMLGYNVLGKGLFGERFAGVCLNMLELKKDKPANFSRTLTDSVPYSLERFKSTILYANRIINEYKELPVGEWPATHLDTGCRTIYGMCEYASECKWGF